MHVVGKDEDFVLLLPTSGTSGASKLTIVTQSMLLHQVAVPQQGKNSFKTDSDSVS